MEENKNQMNVEEGKKNFKNERKGEGYRMENYYHPFWSLFNDCFGDDSTSEVMKTDISENESGYQLEVEVPGVDKKDIRLSLDKGYLTIACKINKKDNQGHGKYLRSERVSGSFSRSFYIGNSVKKEDVAASCNNGVLTVTIQKPQELKHEEKFIEVK